MAAAARSSKSIAWPELVPAGQPDVHSDTKDTKDTTLLSLETKPFVFFVFIVVV